MVSYRVSWKKNNVFKFKTMYFGMVAQGKTKRSRRENMKPKPEKATGAAASMATF